LYTYIIQGDPTTPVKIGRTEDVARRLADLQTANPMTLRVLLVRDGDHEAELHQLFAEDRIQGEWFHFSTRIRRYLESCFASQPYVWRMMHIYASKEQRQQYERWRSELWLTADKIRDYMIRACIKAEMPIPQEMHTIFNFIGEAPIWSDES
jgi:hypothetical protein